MKKQPIILLLLVCLFGQPLFAAVLPLASGLGCNLHSNIDCTAVVQGHIEHTMLMASDPGDTPCDGSSMNCEYCSVVCQPSLISNASSLVFSQSQSLSEFLPIDATLDLFLSSPYRPPIFA